MIDNQNNFVELADEILKTLEVKLEDGSLKWMSLKLYLLIKCL